MNAQAVDLAAGLSTDLATQAALLWLALGAYGGAMLAGVPSLRATGSAPRAQALAGWALAAAVTVHGASLVWRWATLGHGPFTTMHEILSSNLWSLSLVLLIASTAVAELRAARVLALPVMAVLAAWLLLADGRPGHLPPTYDTPLLYLHTLVGKLFLGLLLCALALAAVPALRCSAWGAARCAGLPDDRRFDALAHRFAGAAFVFESLMLIVGACWAQDAWGRYWGWDPLETWAFLTWLALALALHTRATLRVAPARFAAMLAGVFVLAFLTFFGVPFVSTVPHQGAI